LMVPLLSLWYSTQDLRDLSFFSTNRLGELPREDKALINPLERIISIYYRKASSFVLDTKKRTLNRGVNASLSGILLS